MEIDCETECQCVLSSRITREQKKPGQHGDNCLQNKQTKEQKECSNVLKL